MVPYNVFLVWYECWKMFSFSQEKIKIIFNKSRKELLDILGGSYPLLLRLWDFDSGCLEGHMHGSHGLQKCRVGGGISYSWVSQRVPNPQGTRLVINGPRAGHPKGHSGTPLKGSLGQRGLRGLGPSWLCRMVIKKEPEPSWSTVGRWGLSWGLTLLWSLTKC